MKLVFFSVVTAIVFSFSNPNLNPAKGSLRKPQTDICCCNMVLDYTIVSSPYVNGIYFQIKDSIKKGWRPIGGLSMAPVFDNNKNKADMMVIQAMVKYK
jgi:hypothetical protein